MRHCCLPVILSLLILSGCGGGGDDAGDTGGITADDARQLNEAADMLDMANQPPLPGNSSGIQDRE